MSYQFIHVEDYSKVIAKKRGNGGKGKYNEETKGRSVRDIIACLLYTSPSPRD